MLLSQRSADIPWRHYICAVCQREAGRAASVRKQMLYWYKSNLGLCLLLGKREKDEVGKQPYAGAEWDSWSPFESIGHGVFLYQLIVKGI